SCILLHHHSFPTRRSSDLLMTAYFLFAWIHSYNNEQKVEEHVQIQMELDDLKQILDDPKLYTSQTDRKKIKKYADQTKSITLYEDRKSTRLNSSHVSISYA